MHQKFPVFYQSFCMAGHNADPTNRTRAVDPDEMQELLGIIYRDRKMNDFACTLLKSPIVLQEFLLTAVMRQKLKWFGHFARQPALSKMLLQSYVEGGLHLSIQRKGWVTHTEMWTDHLLGDLLG